MTKTARTSFANIFGRYSTIMVNNEDEMEMRKTQTSREKTTKLLDFEDESF